MDEYSDANIVQESSLKKNIEDNFADSNDTLEKQELKTSSKTNNRFQIPSLKLDSDSQQSSSVDQEFTSPSSKIKLTSMNNHKMVMMSLAENQIKSELDSKQDDGIKLEPNLKVDFVEPKSEIEIEHSIFSQHFTQDSNTSEDDKDNDDYYTNENYIEPFVDIQTGCDDEDDELENTGNVLVCPLCPRKFKSPAGLKMHSLFQHSDTRQQTDSTFPCSYCGASFGGKEYLRRHLKRAHTSEFRVACPECPEKFPDSTTMDLHFETFHSATTESCSHCGKFFKNAELVRRHVNRVHATADHICQKCGEDCVNRKLLKEHEKLIHLQDRWTCQFCTLIFSRKTNLRSHMYKMHQEDFKFNCGECPRRYPDSESLDRHFHIVHGAKNWECPLCLKSFSTRANLRDHGKKYHRDPSSDKPVKLYEDASNHRCQFCPSAFKLKLTLAKHLRTVHSDEEGIEAIVSPMARRKKMSNPEEDGIWPCDFCSEMFESKMLLLRHCFADHNHLGTYACPMCRKEFPELVAMLTHKFNDHLGKRVRCRHCQQFYANDKKLRWHIKAMHPQVLKFSCDLCSRKFEQEEDLAKHNLSFHERDRPYECGVCLKRFHKLCHVNRHTLKQHPETNRFSCEICNKEFPNMKMVKFHKSRFHLEKTFGCSHCEKSFSTQKILSRHIEKVHKTKTELFKCEICQDNFTSVSSRALHVAKVHTTKPFQCRHCERGYFLKSSLNRHTCQKGSSKNDSCGDDEDDESNSTETKTNEKRNETKDCHKSNRELGASNSEFSKESDVDQITNKVTYKCDHCKKTYFSLKGLKNHQCHVDKIEGQNMRQELQDEAFECSACQRTYSNKRGLTRHKCRGISCQEPDPLAMPKKLMEIGCDFCGLTFSTFHLRSVHVSKDHKDKMIVCASCNSSFESEMSCSRHVCNVIKHEKTFKKRKNFLPIHLNHRRRRITSGGESSG